MDTDNFIVYIKTDYIYKDNADDIKTRLILQIMNQIDHYQIEKIKNNWISER